MTRHSTAARVLTQAGADRDRRLERDTDRMDMLADRVDAVIGVDTHTDTHTAAICDARGGRLATVTVATTAAGYAQLLDAAAAAAPGPRLVWAIEGTGSYGAGLTDLLLVAGAEVIEVRAAVRPRGQSKNDTNDALAIARAALAQTETQHARPRTGAVRDALALLLNTRAADVATRTSLINRLKATVLKAPASLRDKLRDLPTDTQIATAARLRGPRNPDTATRYYLQVLHAITAQITALTVAIKDAEASLDELTATHAAPLRAEYGIGPVSAAQLLISWTHDASTPRPPSPHSQAPARWRPPPGAPPATGSTAPATVNSTPPCTGSSSAAEPTTTSAPANTSPSAPPTAKPPARSNAASSATSPDTSTGSCKPARPALTGHRSVANRRRHSRPVDDESAHDTARAIVSA